MICCCGSVDSRQNRSVESSSFVQLRCASNRDLSPSDVLLHCMKNEWNIINNIENDDFEIWIYKRTYAFVHSDLRKGIRKTQMNTQTHMNTYEYANVQQTDTRNVCWFWKLHLFTRIEWILFSCEMMICETHKCRRIDESLGIAWYLCNFAPQSWSCFP